MMRTILATGFAGLGASISLDTRNSNNQFLASYEGTDQKDGFDLHVDVSAEIRETLQGLAVDLLSTHPVDGMASVRGASVHPHRQSHPDHAPTTPEPPAGLWTPILGSENGEQVKCNNNVNMVYVADQATCQQLAVDNGHPFYSFRHNAQSGGHKCMSSAHCDDHIIDRTKGWHIYSAEGYHYGVVASNECETHDVNEAECLAAVQSLLPTGVVQGRTDLVAGSWGHVPPGCSVQSHSTSQRVPDWAAHYNRNPSGNNDGSYTPVCNV